MCTIRERTNSFAEICNTANTSAVWKMMEFESSPIQFQGSQIDLDPSLIYLRIS